MPTLKENFEFDLRGYLIIPKFLSEEKAEELNTALEATNGHGVKLPFLLSHPDWLGILSDPRTLQYCAAWIGPKFRFDHGWAVQHPPGDGSHQNMHGGPLSSEGMFDYTYRQGSPRTSCLVLGIALKEQPAGKGGVVFIPGSHKSNVSNKRVLKELYAETDTSAYSSTLVHTPVMRPGDAVLFTEALVHGTKSWTHTDWRRNCYLKYCLPSSGWIPQNDPEIVELRGLAKTGVQSRLLAESYLASKTYDVAPRWRADVLNIEPKNNIAPRPKVKPHQNPTKTPPKLQCKTSIKSTL